MRFYIKDDNLYAQHIKVLKKALKCEFTFIIKTLRFICILHKH
jgi:hypothetical protein